MNRMKVFIVLTGVLIILIGFWQLRIDVNIFNLLPANSPMVEGLQLYQRSFGSSRELIISIRMQNAEQAEEAARSLAEKLEGTELTPRVIWRSPLRSDPAQIAELLAFLWYNQPSEQFDRLTLKLSDEQLQQTLDNTLERMATSFRPLDIARLSHDPFALTDLPENVASPMAGLNKDPFASADGSFRILFVASPYEKAGFWKYRRWVADVTGVVRKWEQENHSNSSIRVRITGTPAFVAQTGSGLMRDMQMATLGTMFLVAGLFWLVHRRWLPLLWLVSLLMTILMATVALGTLILGTLNAVSLGFAAILMGLAADYALILYQEHKADPSLSVAELRSALSPSILWAAVTTAGAFFLVGRSSLPGLTQLGTLVGIGILIAAAVMLMAFLPPLERFGKLHPVQANDLHTKPIRMLKPRSIWMFTLIAAVGSLLIVFQRLPAIDYSTQNLGPKENPVKAALEEVQTEIGGFDDVLWLIISGMDESDVARQLEKSATVLDGSVDDGLLTGYSLPVALWPQPDHQTANRTAARQLVARHADVRTAALGAGFTADSLQLTDEIFHAWKRFAYADEVVWPSHPGSQWVYRQFSGRDSGRQLVLGKLEASTGATQDNLLVLAAQIGSATGGRMFGWSLLSESLMGVMERDIKRVLIPMAVALLLLLGFAFRSVTEIFLSINTLCFSLLCLMGLMVLFDWSWNLMNVMALPLLFGAGVDYSIHIQFALRRSNGDRRRVYRTVGRAILLCGASTASGFGTLGMASNTGVASLGRVCAAGIIIISLTSVYLLPVWWRTLQRRSDLRSEFESG